MNAYRTEIEALIILEPDCYRDARGWFMETYNKKRYEGYGIYCDFVQDNASYTAHVGVIRGLHFQTEPMAQSKLVRCSRGEIFDVAVDLRIGSPTYKKWVGVTLSGENNKQFFIPAGFAHGFITRSINVEVQYKVDNFYSPAHDKNLRFDDPEIGVDWGFENPTLSDKDKNAPFLADCGANFRYGAI